jgi:hypothetical protein
MNVDWRFHKDGEFISNLKVKKFRDEGYLDWLRSLKCFSCRTVGFPPYQRVTASHIFRGYYGLKNHDWGAVPMCPSCHLLYEYHKDKYLEKFGKLPMPKDAEAFYQKYLKVKNKEDTRTSEQMVPI